MILTLSYSNFITAGFQLISRVLSTAQMDEEHTAENLAAPKTVLHEWKITDRKVIAVVTDNGSNMVKAIRDFTPFRHIPCFVHTFNLVIKIPYWPMNTFSNCWKNAAKLSRTLRKVLQRRLS
jgi:hypothetical protein